MYLYTISLIVISVKLIKGSKYMSIKEKLEEI